MLPKKSEFSEKGLLGVLDPKKASGKSLFFKVPERWEGFFGAGTPIPAFSEARIPLPTPLLAKSWF